MYLIYYGYSGHSILVKWHMVFWIGRSLMDYWADDELHEYARSVVELRVFSWFTKSSHKVLQQRVCAFEQRLGIAPDDPNLKPYIEACPGLECDRLNGISHNNNNNNDMIIII